MPIGIDLLIFVNTIVMMSKSLFILLMLKRLIPLQISLFSNRYLLSAAPYLILFLTFLSYIIRANNII